MNLPLLLLSLLLIGVSFAERSVVLAVLGLAAFVGAAIVATHAPSRKDTPKVREDAAAVRKDGPVVHTISLEAEDLPNLERDTAALESFSQMAPRLGTIQLLWGHRSEPKKEIANYTTAEVQRLLPVDEVLEHIDFPEPRVLLLPLTRDRRFVALGPGILVGAIGDSRDYRYRHWLWKDLSTSKVDVLIREPESRTPIGAKVVERSWFYVNDDGTPNRNHSYNPPANVVKYVDLRVSYGGDRVLHARFLSREGADALDHLLTGRRPDHGSQSSGGSASRSNSAPPPPRTEYSGNRSAHEVLGVSPGADQNAIRNAYRDLVKQYHPDRVANLAPEIKELADRRMREINQAYEEIGNS